MELMIGIDVGKAGLDVYADGLDVACRFENTAAGIALLVEQLAGWDGQGHTLRRILCEATGGYERTLVTDLASHGLVVEVVHATHVRDFARAIGQWAKTDRIDAAMIARFGRTMPARPKAATTTPEHRDLRALLGRRDSLIATRIAETNRLDKHLPDVMRHSIERHVAWLKAELKQLDQALRRHIEATPALCQAIDLLTAAMITAELPELGKAGLPQLAALTGLAPWNRDSGSFKGKRHIKGGRAVPRKTLYMAAFASIRHNAQIKIFYQRLTKAGKPHKLAIIACARKLLAILNSVARRNQPWTENYPCTS
jgi:transposase